MIKNTDELSQHTIYSRFDRRLHFTESQPGTELPCGYWCVNFIRWYSDFACWNIRIGWQRCCSKWVGRNWTHWYRPRPWYWRGEWAGTIRWGVRWFYCIKWSRVRSHRGCSVCGVLRSQWSGSHRSHRWGSKRCYRGRPIRWCYAWGPHPCDWRAAVWSSWWCSVISWWHCGSCSVIPRWDCRSSPIIPGRSHRSRSDGSGWRSWSSS